MNPLYNSQFGNNNVPNQFQNGINAARNLMNTLQNPTQMLNDPRVKQALNLCRGSTPEQVFYQMCAQRGIDPQAFLRELQRK